MEVKGVFILNCIMLLKIKMVEFVFLIIVSVRLFWWLLMESFSFFMMEIKLGKLLRILFLRELLWIVGEII